MNVPPCRNVPHLTWHLTVPVAVAMILLSCPALAASWYEHYANAEQALGDQDWTQAVAEINEALEKKGDSGARVRSYGMNVVAYFPYFKLGVAYYHLGQFDAALQAFETETRLGAILKSESDSADLERYRALAQDARTTAAAEEAGRIRQIVEQSLADARALENQGRLTEAMAALDQALAVAPDDTDAKQAMAELRQQFAEQQGALERAQRVARLVDQGRALLSNQQYSEAASVLREALFIEPSTEIQALLDEAQGEMLSEHAQPAATGAQGD